MRNKGMSLIEVTIVIAISTVIGLAITFNFVAAEFFRRTTENNIELTREARIATNHMTRVLRFAKPGTLSAGSNQISATIEGGHLNFITSDTAIAYTRDTVDKTLEYTQGVEAAVVIAGGGARNIDIAYFEGDWDGDGGTIDSAATADGGASVKFTCSAAHGLQVNDYVTLAGFAVATTYNGSYIVTAIDGVTFTVTLTWDQDDDGTFVIENPTLEIQLTAQKGDRSVSLLTKIRPLGE